MANGNVIAKNTMLLYVRMLFLMFISLFTSRVILDSLGVMDFGIYNVVGGVVGMMGFLTNSLGTAVQRFINFAMGEDDSKELSQVFNSAIYLSIIESIFVFIIGESVGLYIFNNYLTIPQERMEVAFYVYQISIATMILGIFSVPFYASIIAHEKMGAFAFISIFEGVGKLAFAYGIYISRFDKLMTYTLLLALMGVVVELLYVLYCHRFKECRFSGIWNTIILKKMLVFSWWMFFGTSTKMLSTQGVNILINAYFNPIMNAARAIALQVQGAISRFSDDFLLAVKPQLVKSYAENDMTNVVKIVVSSSKISFFLIFVISLPILFEADYVLGLWLKNPPEITGLFLQLILLDFYITVTYSPLGFLSQATGNVKNYQLIIAVSFLLIFLGSWWVLDNGFPAYSVFIIMIFIDFIALFARLQEICINTKFPLKDYISGTFSPVCKVLFFTLAICYLISFIENTNLLLFIIKSLAYLLVSCSFVFLLGLEDNERNFIITKVKYSFLRKNR